MSPLSTTLLIGILLPGQAAPAWVIQTEPGRRFEAVYRTEIRSTTFAAVEWNVYAAIAPDLPSQTRMKTTLQPEGTKVAELSDQKRPILHAKVVAADEKAAHILAVSVKYEGALVSRRLVKLPRGAKPPKVEQLTEEERNLYLAETKLHDFKAPAFQKWLGQSQLMRGKTEPDVEFGRRVFHVVVGQYKYELTGDWLPVSGLCAKTKADCDGMAAVFVSAMRANKIPARMLSGLPAKSAMPNQGTIIGHARAEFYAAGVGWVPADPAYAKGNKEYFGQDNADLVVGHIDYELIVPMPQGPRDQPNLSKPAFFALGKGKFDAKFYPVSWEVTFLP